MPQPSPSTRRIHDDRGDGRSGQRLISGARWLKTKRRRSRARQYRQGRISDLGSLLILRRAELCSQDLPVLRAGRAVTRSWRLLRSRDLPDSSTGLDRGVEIERRADFFGTGCACEGAAFTRTLEDWQRRIEKVSSPGDGIYRRIGVELGTRTPGTSKVMRSRNLG